MKKAWFGISVILVILLFVSCASLGPTLTPEQLRIVEIVDCPGIDKNRLFVRANSWAVDAFVSAESVIEFSDKEAGIVKGKYATSFSIYSFIFVYTYNARTTLTIEVKDGAARITIADPYTRMALTGGSWTSYSPYDMTVEAVNERLMPKYLDLIASFKEAMQAPKREF